jgi:hypothetical protein
VTRAHAVELVEVGLDEGAGDLDGPVAAEVVEDHRIAVLDGADGLAGVGDDELGQILVDGAGVRSRRPLTASVALANCGPSPSTWVFQPFSTIAQLAS